MESIFCCGETSKFVQVGIIVFDGIDQACPKYPKQEVISFQYLKKEVKDGVNYFAVEKHQSLYKLASLFLVELTRHVQSTKNRKLVIFLQYLKKKMLQLLLCSILMQNIQIFFGGPVMFVVTCFFLKNDYTIR